MSKGKAILGGLAALAVGGFLVYTGVKEYRNSKRLVNEGKSAVAKVNDKDMTTGRKGRRSYYLSVEFKPEAGQQVEQRVQVSSGDYDAATVGGTVPVQYLADKPEVCQVGNKAQVKWTNLAIGAFLSLFGGFGVARQASSGEQSSSSESSDTADNSDYDDSSGDEAEAA
jgi:hypothetical protein